MQTHHHKHVHSLGVMSCNGIARERAHAHLGVDAGVQLLRVGDKPRAHVRLPRLLDAPLQSLEVSVVAVIPDTHVLVGVGVGAVVRVGMGVSVRVCIGVGVGVGVGMGAVMR
jgi:hypothetical protein